MIYIAFDGDDVGSVIEKCLIENDEIKIQELSQGIDNCIGYITEYLKSLDCEVIYSSGDSILVKGKKTILETISNRLKNYQDACTFSVGASYTLRDAYIALKYAKSIGKDIIVYYDKKYKFTTIKIK